MSGEMVQDKQLPFYPAKGERQKLDKAWLDLLYQEGIARHLEEVPGPPPELGRALGEFNRGAYWHCHETLEAIWLPEQYPLRLFYHALIKAAVGLLHLERRNRHGALVKLGDACYTLAPFTPRFMVMDTGSLYQDVKERWERIESSAAPDWDAIERLPPVQIRTLESPYSQPGG